TLVLAQSRRTTAVSAAQGALDAVDIAACRPADMPADHARVAIVLYPDGQWSMAIGPVTWPGHRATRDQLALFHSCIEGAIVRAISLPTTLPAPRRVSVVSRTWNADGSSGPHGATSSAALGDEGAICAWGQYRPDWASLPPPARCRAGLTCCGGGAAGSDSSCMRAAHGMCPPLP
ncbi:MAG: hypothetical protein U0353_33905, partial [Sandaracinus sp.]